MPYIGKSPVAGGFHKLDNLTASATDTYALTLGSAAYYPESANQLLVSLNGVIQAPQDSFTVSGSNIVFDSALTASDSIDFIVALGDVIGVGSVTDGAITTAKLGNGAVTAAKVDPTLHLSTIKDSTGTNTGITIDSSGRVLLPELVAFSAKWATGGSTTTAYLQSWTATCNQGGAFDASSGTFTAPVDGTYMFHVNILAEDFSGSDTDIYVYKNASDVLFRLRDTTRNSRFQSLSGSIIVDLVASDYVSVYVAGYLTSHTDPWHIFSGRLLG